MRAAPHHARSTLSLPALLVPALFLTGCGEPDPPTPDQGAEVEVHAVQETALSAEQERFWSHLEALCGEAYRGVPIDAPEDSDWWESELVMHVRECETDEIRIPLHVDADRSRTWVVTRTDRGLRLKHDHRLEDGSPDRANTEYGGDTTERGTETRQEFPADAYSIEAVPGRADQYWYLEIHPGESFVYGLLREGNGLRYRVEFDVTDPVDPPPPPWGS